MRGTIIDDDSERMAELFAWARAHGAIGLNQVEVAYFEKSGIPVRGFAAACHLKEPILLPRSLLMTAASAEELAFSLATERAAVQEGGTSFWGPWIRTLPSPEELSESHLGYAAPALLRLFSALPLVARVEEWKAKVEADWQALSRQEAASKISLEDFIWASAVVTTRFFPPPPSLCFMPFADMMNTGPTPNMEVYDSLELDCENSTAVAEAQYYGLLLVPGAQIHKGQELLQPYKEVDNAERLFRGGFLLEDNPVKVASLSSEACQSLLAQLVPEATSAPCGQPRILASLQALAREHCRQSGIAVE